MGQQGYTTAAQQLKSRRSQVQSFSRSDFLHFFIRTTTQLTNKLFTVENDEEEE